MTLTRLASDSALAGGSNQRAARRTMSVLAMLAGATAGAAPFLQRGAGLPLAISAGADGRDRDCRASECGCPQLPRPEVRRR